MALRDADQVGSGEESSVQAVSSGQTQSSRRHLPQTPRHNGPTIRNIPRVGPSQAYSGLVNIGADELGRDTKLV